MPRAKSVEPDPLAELIHPNAEAIDRANAIIAKDHLYEMRCWSFSLDLWPYAQVQANTFLWTLYRPTAAVRKLMARLSVKYPYLVKSIDNAVDFANRIREWLENDPSLHFSPMN